jgi:predicted Zn-dependent protease
MAAMFDKLDQASRLNDSGGFPYLRSHPLTVDRVAEARSRTALQIASPPARDTAAHEMMQARARVLMDQNVLALRRHAETPATDIPDSGRIGTLYAAVLAASLLNDRATTDHALGALLRSRDLDPDIGAYGARLAALLRSEVLLARGETDDAGDLPGIANDTVSRPALLMRAQAALLNSAAGRANGRRLHQAEQALQEWIAEHGSDAAAWDLLAKCADAMGNRLRSLRAQAEARAASGDLGAAIDRLRAAQAVSRRAVGADLVEASVIDARLRDLEERWRENAVQSRGQGSGASRLLSQLVDRESGHARPR